eukprot:6212546-Pleurochrysis_carterae.AAC.5
MDRDEVRGRGMAAPASAVAMASLYASKAAEALSSCKQRGGGAARHVGNGCLSLATGRESRSNGSTTAEGGRGSGYGRTVTQEASPKDAHAMS